MARKGRTWCTQDQHGCGGRDDKDQRQPLGQGVDRDARPCTVEVRTSRTERFRPVVPFRKLVVDLVTIADYEAVLAVENATRPLDRLGEQFAVRARVNSKESSLIIRIILYLSK